MAMKIEKNIPLPMKHRMVQLAADMELTDSVFFKDGGTGDGHSRKKGNSLVAQLKRLNRKGIIQRVEGGFRVWRLS